MSFFSDKEYGPYHGSIIAVTSPEWPIKRIFSKQRAFGDFCGIYYRYFRWADSGNVLWTLSVSLFYPMIVFAVLPTIWGWKRWRRVAVGTENPKTSNRHLDREQRGRGHGCSRLRPTPRPFQWS